MVKRGFAEILQRHRPTHFGCDYNKFLKIKQGRKALKKKGFIYKADSPL